MVGPVEIVGPEEKTKPIYTAAACAPLIEPVRDYEHNEQTKYKDRRHDLRIPRRQPL